jgi:adenylosuccinate lyase
LLPEGFLLVEEVLRRAQQLVQGLVFHDGQLARNLATYGVFAATERLLMELVKRGADRQAMHELIRRHSLSAWEAVRCDASGPNPLADLLASDPEVLAFLPEEQVRALLHAEDYVGDAPLRAREIAGQIREALGELPAPPAARAT